MKKLVIKEPVDVLLMVARRKWWALLAFLPLAAATVLVALLLPSVYVSETLVLVESRDAPNDIVRDLVTLDTSERLVAVQQKILSRTNLSRILNEFASGFDEWRRLNEAQQIERLRGRINIEITTGRRGRETLVPYFNISYSDTDPVLAQKVTARLAELFIYEDSKTREEQVFGLKEFLQKELDKQSIELQRVEAQLAELKERYRYELPEQLDTNLRTLDRLNEQLKSLDEQRSRYLTAKLEIEQRLSETSPVISREQIRRQALSATAPNPLVVQYRQKEAQLRELQSRYTDRHPDIARLQTELEKLREVIPPEDLLEVDPVLQAQAEVINEPNPVHQQLTSQLASINTELRINEQRQEEIRRDLLRYAKRVENTPRREQEIFALQRQYEGLSAKYRDLEAKLSDAQLTESLESAQKGEKLEIVDSASFPLNPAKPNRLLVVLGGLGIALAVSVGLALAVEFLDQKIWTPSEVTQLLGLPLIGEIPEILSPTEISARSRRALLRVAGYGALSVLTAAAVFLIFRTPSVREQGTETLARLLGW